MYIPSTFFKRFLALAFFIAIIFSLVAIGTFAATGVDRYTVLILHGDGADASTTFTDSSFVANTVTPSGNAQIDTAQSKFGSASMLFDGSGDYLSVTANNNFVFGIDDFTIDVWIRLGTTGTTQYIYSGGTSGASLYVNSSNQLVYWQNNGSTYITGSTALSSGQWYHVALARSGGQTKLFLNGTQEGSTASESVNYTQNAPTIGRRPGIGNDFNGHLEELRVSKGVARWTANFTAPTGEYGPDGRITTFLTSGTSWTVPSDWNSSRNTIEVIGGGGGGGGATSMATRAASGGGGGAYSRAINVSLTPGGTVTYAVGAGGTAGANDTTGGTGGDTYFCNSTSNCASVSGTAVVAGAKGGTGAAANTGGTPGVGGAAASGVGTVKYSGGDGVVGVANVSSSGGGGAAGPRGEGEDAPAVGTGTAGGRGGRGGAGYGGLGGTDDASGTTGNEWGFGFGSGGGGGTRNSEATGITGSAYGGGGGGYYSTGNNGAGGAGAAGIVVITYYPSTAPGLTLNGGRFLSNLDIRGNLAKGSGTFAIDHPLRPGTHILYHSFVESPDVKNLYDGIAELDENGEATITLPNYFEALNKDFRYLYFPLEKAMPELYIKEEIQNNQFTIGGGVPRGKVSWQVTGIRHDPYILAHPIEVEVEKGPDTLKDKGECLYEPACAITQ